jgi:DNA-binding Lrp family transcriptional regulator
MLTTTQKKILKLLAINSHYSNKDLSKSVGISEDAVRYQIIGLIKKQKLANFINNFHFKSLGYDHHHYLIRFKDITTVNIEQLMLIKEIFFINTSSGRYDIQLIISHTNDEELMDIKEYIDKILAGNIDDSLMLKYYYQYKFTNIIPIYDVAVKLPINKKNPLYKLNKEDWRTIQKIPSPITTFTAGEKKTIQYLITDPQATYTLIGKKTSQSYETVRQQIIKLAKKGHLANFGIFPNFDKLNMYTNYILLNIDQINDEIFGKYIRTNPRIFYAAKLIGKYNVILYFVSEKPSELHDEIQKLRKLFPNKIVESEMLSFDKIHKSVQFPMVLLD